MEIRAAVKVGLMAILGMALLFAGWAFFAHLSFDTYLLGAVFNDTKGLQRQTPVRMNGVTIGEVRDIALDPGTLRPVVTLAIDRQFTIPGDSRISITSGLLIANPQIEIKPGTSTSSLPKLAESPLRPAQFWPAAYVQAEPLGGLAQISPEADRAVRQLADTMGRLTPQLEGAVADLRGILKRTDRMMADFEGVSRSAHGLVADPKIRQTMHATLNDMQAISREARQTAHSVSLELRSTVRRNSGKFDELANGAVDLLQKFADTVDAARGAVTRLTEQVSDPRLQQSLQETLDLAKATVARFGQVASDIHQLTGDPVVQSDLKTTLTTLKETSEQGQQIAERLNNLLGKINLPSGGPNIGIGQPSLAIDFMGRTDAPHFRSDINLRFPIGQNNAFNLGLYDFAETYKLNAQYETGIQGFGALRYGIYASKLGVGLDWPVSPRTQFRLDAYNPNRFQLDARAQFHVNDDFALWLGADSLFRHTTPLIGVRLKR